MTSVTVIGIGNTLMGDDGVGVVVAEALASRDHGADVNVTIGYTAGMALMPAVQDAEHVIIIDAMDAGEAPGSVFRFDAEAVGLPQLRSTTSHGVGVPQLVAAARLLGNCAPFTVFAVQVGDIMCGPDTLSPQVREALPDIVGMVEAEAESIAHGTSSG